jgi:hypothetical protein
MSQLEGKMAYFLQQNTHTHTKKKILSISKAMKNWGVSISDVFLKTSKSKNANPEL